jgi:MscS family membrane protein
VAFLPWAVLYPSLVMGAEGDASPSEEAPSVETATAVVVSPDSPRAALSGFLEAAAQGDYVTAAEYLDASREQAARGPSLAERLHAVLEQNLQLDLENVSPLAEGKLDDKLPASLEEIGTIPNAAGEPEPVQMVRRQSSKTSRWLFTRATVGRTEGWYKQLENRWLLEHLPPILLRTGPLGIALWQWLAFPAVLAAAWLVGRLLAAVTVGLLRKLAARTHATWDDNLLSRLKGPTTAAFMMAAIEVSMFWLPLSASARATVDRAVEAGVVAVVFWGLVRALDVLGERLIVSPWAAHHAASRSLVPLGVRIGKVALLALAVVAVMSQFGYPVATLLTGLGLGGLAIALAGQKTLENLFGAFSLGLDQPFRVGDFVKVEDFVGTVEAIGLRSTRIRTLDRTLISLPNGKLADMRLESFTARDRLRFACIIGLQHQTSPAQMREVLAEMERVLRAHPKIWPDAVVVKFMGVGASSFDIEVMAWFQMTDWGEFQGVRQEILLQFMEIVERSGTAFAVPTTRAIQVPPKERAPVRA